MRAAETADDVELTIHIAAACGLASEVAGFPIPARSVDVAGWVDRRADVRLRVRRLVAVESLVYVSQAGTVQLEGGSITSPAGPIAIISPPSGGWGSTPYRGARVRATVRAGLADIPAWRDGASVPPAVLEDSDYAIRAAVLLTARSLARGMSAMPALALRVLSDA